MAKKRARLASAAFAGLALGVAGLSQGGAGAQVQTVTATLLSSVSISTNPTANVSLGNLPAAGTTQASGGSIGVTANVAYTVSAQADKPKLTKYVAGAYDDSVRLTNAMSIVATPPVGCTCVAVAAPAVGTTAVPIAQGTLPATDVFGITLAQVTVPGDVPTSYRSVVTYTAAATVP